MPRRFENYWNPGFSNQVHQNLSGTMWVACDEEEGELSFFHDLTGDAITFRGNRKEIFVWKMSSPGRIAILRTHNVPHVPYHPAELALVNWYELVWEEFVYKITESAASRDIFLQIDLFAGRFQLERYVD